MPTDDILVSIVCPAYNHERYIRQTLDGFLMQRTNFKYEILISDDASTDSTADIIREYEKKYPDIIKPIYHTENQYSQHIAPTRPFWQTAKGKYIAKCEGDDFWIDPDKLQMQVDYLEAHPECAACTHAAFNSFENGVIKQNRFRPFTQSRVVGTDEIISRWLFPTASIVYRKSMRPGYFVPFKKNAPCGDYPLMVYLALNGTVYYIDRFMSVYRNNSVSSVNRSKAKSKEKVISKWTRMVELMERIDEYTEHQYHAAVMKYLLENEFLRLIAVGKLSEVFKSKYFSCFSSKKKVKLILAVAFPFLLEKRNNSQKNSYQDCLDKMKELKYENLVVNDEAK